jgi:hypothetical protein
MSDLVLWHDDPSPTADGGTVPGSLTAAAKKVDLSAKGRSKEDVIRSEAKVWQNRAWRYYDSIDLVASSANFIANALRRVRIFPASMSDEEEAPVALVDGALSARAALELDRLRGATGTHGDLLHDLGLQYSVPGECYLAGNWNDPETGQPQPYAVYSTDELVRKGDGQWQIMEGGPRAENLDISIADADVIRMYRRSGRFRSRATSPLVSVLDDCEEYLILSMLMRSTGRSRVNNGLLLVPEEAKLPEPPTSGASPSQVNAWINAVVQLFTVPLSDEGNALAVAPGVMTVKGEFIEKFRHLVFERKFDAIVLERIEHLRRYIATGIDLPSAVVLDSVADANHWNAWFIDDDTFDSHIAPTIELICSDITEGYLRPAMADVTGAETVVVWYDGSDLISHPTRSTDADKALEQGAIGYSAYRRYKGFNEADAATPEDLDQIERMKSAARTQVTTGDPTGGDTTEGAPSQARIVVVADAGRPDTQHLGDQLARIDRDVFARVHAASQSAVFRALEKAGAKMRRQMQGDPHMKAAVAEVPNFRLVGWLVEQGHEFAEADDFGGDDIVAPIAASYMTWVLAAQAKVRRLAREYGDLPTSTEAEQLAAAQAGLAALTAGLLAVVAETMFPTAAAETRGEVDPSALVNASIVRESLAVAGGHPGDQLVDASTNQPVGGVATGLTAMDLFAQLSITPSSWTWTYTGGAPTPFPGHEDLDGVEFLDWTDDALRTQPGDEWIGEFYSVGDHTGCLCDFVPTMSDDQAAEPGDEGDAG